MTSASDDILNVLFSIFLTHDIDKFPVMLIIQWVYPATYFCTITFMLVLGTLNRKSAWISLTD